MRYHSSSPSTAPAAPAASSASSASSPRASAVAPALAVPLVLVALVSLARAQAGVHTDAQLGIKIRPPSGWAYVGGDGDRGLLRALFVSPQEVAPKANEEGVPHAPALRLLFFRKQPPAADAAAGGAPAAAASATGLPLRTPYRDFADYLARVHGPTTAPTSKTHDKIGALAATWHLASVPRQQGALTLHACVVTLDDGDLAIELEVLSEHHARFAAVFEKAVKTLAPVPRVPAAAAPASSAAAATEAPPWEKDRAEWLRRPATERATQRREWGARWLAEREKRTEPGYKPQRAGPYLLVSRADPAFTKRAVEAAVTLHKWVEKRFASLNDEMVMPAAIRLMATRTEHDAYLAREPEPRAYDPRRREIFFFKDADAGNAGDGFGPLFSGILEHYLSEKDPAIVRSLPRWLDHGLGELLRSTRVKGAQLTFYAGEVEMGRMRYHEQNDTMPPLWSLLQESIVATPTDGAEEPPWGYVPECARALRWLDAGGSKALGKDDLLLDYVRTVGVAGGSGEVDPATDVDWLQLNEPQRKDLRQKQYTWRDTLLKRINDGVIALNEDAWRKADAAWKEFNQKFKG